MTPTDAHTTRVDTVASVHVFACTCGINGPLRATPAEAHQDAQHHPTTQETGQ